MDEVNHSLSYGWDFTMKMAQNKYLGSISTRSDKNETNDHPEIIWRELDWSYFIEI